MGDFLLSNFRLFQSSKSGAKDLSHSKPFTKKFHPLILSQKELIFGVLF